MTNLDAAAKAARERAELAAATGNGELALEACAMLDELFRAGYRLTEIAPDEVTEVRPVLFTLKKSEAWCAVCSAVLPIGTKVWWQRNTSGVECQDCHARKAA